MSLLRGLCRPDLDVRHVHRFPGRMTLIRFTTSVPNIVKCRATRAIDVKAFNVILMHRSIAARAPTK